DVRQRGRTDHQAEDQRQEVATRDVTRVIVLARERFRVPRDGRRARGQATLCRPFPARRVRVLRILRQRVLGLLDRRRIAARLRVGDRFLERGLAFGERLRNVLQLLGGGRGTVTENLADL